jgi:hypothetical protein
MTADEKRPTTPPDTMHQPGQHACSRYPSSVNDTHKHKHMVASAPSCCQQIKTPAAVVDSVCVLCVSQHTTVLLSNNQVLLPQSSQLPLNLLSSLPACHYYLYCLPACLPILLLLPACQPACHCCFYCLPSSDCPRRTCITKRAVAFASKCYRQTCNIICYCQCSPSAVCCFTKLPLPPL